MSSLRIATFHSFNTQLRVGDKCEIAVIWQKDLSDLGNGCRGPGYTVREVLFNEHEARYESLGVFYGKFADADAIKCAIAKYRSRKKEYCEFHRIPWDCLPGY